MANPRRIGIQLHNHHSTIPLSNHSPPPAVASLSCIAAFLKRPSAFPFVLSLFLVLTWLCLRVQRTPGSASLRFRAQSQSGRDADADANLARFSASSLISNDRRGWLFNPIGVALDKGIHGEIRPGSFRGNHRHHTCNETFLIWGAQTKFRLENPHIEGKGYAEVSVGAGEVAVAASPSGTAHALINTDPVRATFFLGCQDSIIDNNSSTTDYKVWEDLLTS
ncbi:hypothetical protein M5K25_011851 [Dendrobium thyrsiflorum]|uniref:Uncharacterized protein n=1 Tax=Dendrobium thyrsiflorum TaxID=117978 RepID=A0ABD0V482_DENTH